MIWMEFFGWTQAKEQPNFVPHKMSLPIGAAPAFPDSVVSYIRLVIYCGFEANRNRWHGIGYRGLRSASRRRLLER